MTSIIQTTASRKLDVRLKARSSSLSGKASCDHRRACPGDQQSPAAAAVWRMVQCFKAEFEPLVLAYLRRAAAPPRPL